MTFATSLKAVAVITLGWLTAVSHAQIYKSITPTGQVVYTDNANIALETGKNSSNVMVLDKLVSLSNTPQAQNMDNNMPSSTATVAPNSSSDIQSQLNPTVTPLPTTATQPSQTGDYRLTIITPAPDMTYRRVTQMIGVEVASSPTLKIGDRFVYWVNGKHIATTADSKINLAIDGYNPGQYLLTVKIENIKGDTVATAERPFYILSNNFAIQKQRKALAKAKADNDKLPWYKKMKVNLSI